jgi:hypothetical protein
MVCMIHRISNVRTNGVANSLSSTMKEKEKKNRFCVCNTRKKITLIDMHFKLKRMKNKFTFHLLIDIPNHCITSRPLLFSLFLIK